MTSLHPLRFVQLCLAVFFGTMASAVALPLLPLQVDVLLDANASLMTLARWTGLIVAATPLVATFTLPVWREVFRRGRGREALLGIWAVSGLLLATIAKAHTVDQLVVLRIGQGALGLAPVLALATIPLLGSERQTVRRSVIMLAVIMTAFVVGAPAGGFMSRAIGVRMTFVFASLLSAGGALILSLGFPAALRSPETDHAPVPSMANSAWWGALACGAAAMGAVVPLLPLYLIDAMAVSGQMAGIWSGVLLGALSLSALIGGLSAILIADLLPLRPSIVINALLAVGFAYLMSRADHVIDLIAWGIAWAYPMSVLLILLFLAPDRLRPSSEQTAFHNLAWVALPLGSALGALISAQLVADQPTALFYVSMLLLGAALPLSLLIRRPKGAAEPSA